MHRHGMLRASFALLLSAAGAGAQCSPAWSPVGAGASGGLSFPVVIALTRASVRVPRLYAGGNFTHMDNLPVNHIAAWNGSSWSAVGGGVSNGDVLTSVYHILEHNDGAGNALYNAGDFKTAGTTPARHVARWDNVSGWSALGPGVNWGGFAANARTIAAYDDGTGTALYFGGYFTHAGTTLVRFVARWNGVAGGWSALGSGMNQPVHDLAVFDDGAGSKLYATGNFTDAGGSPAQFIARWDGAAWSSVGAVGGGLNGSGFDLEVSDVGGAPALFVGGYFTTANGLTVNGIARWQLGGWSNVGSGVASTFAFPGVEAITVFNDGSGPALYAGGQYQTAGGVAAANIARWNGSQWSALGAGIGPGDPAASVYSLGVFAGQLYTGGLFTQAGSTLALYLARWGCACYPDCNGDGQLVVSDFGCFQTRFVQGDLYADCNGDGQLAVSDFGCFQTSFVTGCP